MTASRSSPKMGSSSSRGERADQGPASLTPLTRSPWIPEGGFSWATDRIIASRSSTRTGATLARGTVRAAKWNPHYKGRHHVRGGLRIVGTGSTRLEEGHPHRERQRRVGKIL